MIAAPIRHRKVLTNGIHLQLAEAGPETGPLVILAHGWPESWYSWRHQLTALAAAGYHVVAPDMRGYGNSDAPADVSAYDVVTLAADLAGLLPVCDAGQAAVVGHDWGAVVAWHCALLHPDRFRAVAALSIPHLGRPGLPPTRIWKQRYGDAFYYILYHQQPGVAEAEYESDPRGLLEMLYASPDAPREPPKITDPSKQAGGWIGRWGKPRALPDWLSETDLEYYLGEFRRSGFRGGLNYYRNFDRNWKLTAELDQVVRIPALFIAGAKDPTVSHLSVGDLRERMGRFVPDLRELVWLEGAGHWIQQERHEACNRALIAFLAGI